MRRQAILALALTAAVACGAAPDDVGCEAVETFAAAAGTGRCEAWAQDEARLRAAYEACLPRIDRPSTGIYIPVELFPNGAVKVEAYAEKAQVFEQEGLVWCDGVTLREFEPTGEMKMTCTAAGGVVDRKQRSGWMHGAAQVRYGQTFLSGEGIYFSFSDEFVKISSKVAITSTALKFEGVKL